MDHKIEVAHPAKGIDADRHIGYLTKDTERSCETENGPRPLGPGHDTSGFLEFKRHLNLMAECWLFFYLLSIIQRKVIVKTKRTLNCGGDISSMTHN
jgi:hypothetical protein